MPPITLPFEALPWSAPARRHPLRFHALIAGIGLALIVCGALLS